MTKPYPRFIVLWAAIAVLLFLFFRLCASGGAVPSVSISTDDRLPIVTVLSWDGVTNATVVLAAAVPPIPENTNRYYFAATATDNWGQTSDFSEEVSIPATNRLPLTVRLVWDAPLGWQMVDGKWQNTNTAPGAWLTNFTVHQGDGAGAYTNQVAAGPHLTAGVVISNPPPAPRIVRFYLEGGPSLTLTNPNGSLALRGHAWKVSKTRWPVALEGRTLNPASGWAWLAGPVTNGSQPGAERLRVRVERSGE